jgi:hypothetical protein
LKLADIARIDSGYHFRGRVENDPEGPVAVIQTKDFSDDLKLIPHGLVRIVPETRVAPYEVESGNVLFLSRGQNPWAAVIGELPLTCIVPSSFYILRLARDRILPDYLAWFLNSAATLTALKSIMRGSNIPFISKGDLQELAIPVPTLSVQAQIADLNRLCARERELLNELSHRRKTLIDAVCTNLAASGN